MTTATTAIFPWRDAYSVGISAIDNQHKGLVDLINNLHTAMLAGKGNESLSKILNDLIRYTERHFAYEENLLRDRGYSGTTGHQQEHRELTRQVCALRDQFQAGKIALTMAVMQFLKKWLSDHILQRDMAYAKELNSRERR